MNLGLIIIDDSELDRFIIQRIIQYINKDLSVQSYNSATQALDTIRENQFNSQEKFTLILLDLQMPIMNGFEFIEEFEKLPLHFQEMHKIIILSNTRNPNDIARLLSYKSVDRLLEKPITKEKLQDLITQTALSIQ
jgi:CheY-like chemotaxis protein